MVTVFNVYIGQWCPSASIESNIVLSLNANLRNRITSIDQHPIKAVVFIDECFIILRSGRQPIFLRSGLPHRYGASRIFYGSVIFKQQPQTAGPTGAGRARQYLAVESGELAGHKVAHGHTLHENAALVHIEALLHQINQGKYHLGIMGSADVLSLWHNRQVRAGMLVLNALHLPHASHVGIRKHTDKAFPVCNQCPGGINGMPPAGHQAAVHSKNQRGLFFGIVSLWNIHIPSIRLTVIH